MTPAMMSRKMTAEALGYRVQPVRRHEGVIVYLLYKPDNVYHATFSTEERAWRMASRLMLLNEIQKLQEKLDDLAAEEK